MTDWFTIYTTSSFECPWCIRVKELLQIYGIDYYEKDINESPEYKQEFVMQGFRTVPQVFDEGTLIGGYEKTEEYLRLKHSEKARDGELTKI